MAINLPQAYSKILDKGYTLKSLTAPAFKGKYEVCLLYTSRCV